MYLIIITVLIVLFYFFYKMINKINKKNIILMDKINNNININNNSNCMQPSYFYPSWINTNCDPFYQPCSLNNFYYNGYFYPL